MMRQKSLFLLHGPALHKIALQENGKSRDNQTPLLVTDSGVTRSQMVRRRHTSDSARCSADGNGNQNRAQSRSSRETSKLAGNDQRVWCMGGVFGARAWLRLSAAYTSAKIMMTSPATTAMGVIRPRTSTKFGCAERVSRRMHWNSESLDQKQFRPILPSAGMGSRGAANAESEPF